MGNESWIAEIRPVLRRLGRYAKLAVDLARDGDAPASARAAAAGALAYNLAPVDLVPGIVPVFGQLDDILIPLVLLRRALAQCPASVKNCHLKAQGLTLANIDSDIRGLQRAYRIAGSKVGRAARRIGSSVGAVLRRRRPRP